MIKRWDIDAPASSQYHEVPDGEWVEYRDVEALEVSVSELEAALSLSKDDATAKGSAARHYKERFDAHETRIAQAVAELEHDDYPRHAAQRALALLKGER